MLTDPKHITGLPERRPDRHNLSRQGSRTDFTKTINAVSAKLTLPAILAMNKAVEVDKQSAATVAQTFLQANGLST